MSVSYDNLKIGDTLRVMYDDGVDPEDTDHTMTKKIFANNNILNSDFGYNVLYNSDDVNGIVYTITTT